VGLLVRSSSFSFETDYGCRKTDSRLGLSPPRWPSQLSSTHSHTLDRPLRQSGGSYQSGSSPTTSRSDQRNCSSVCFSCDLRNKLDHRGDRSGLLVTPNSHSHRDSSSRDINTGYLHPLSQQVHAIYTYAIAVAEDTTKS
jgi:hypothetical protein